MKLTIRQIDIISTALLNTLIVLKNAGVNYDDIETLREDLAIEKSKLYKLSREQRAQETK